MYTKKNGGACSARNLGISLAKGEYIGLLDCDDLYLPEKIELSVRFFEKNPDFGFIHSAAYFIDGNGKVLRKFSHRQSRRMGWIAKNLVFRDFICNSTVVVRKACFEKVGLFDERIFTPGDWDMWLRLAEKYKAGYIDIPLVSYRASGSYILSHIEQMKKEERLVLEKNFKENNHLTISDQNKAVSNIHYRCALSYLLIGDFDKTKEELILSLSKNKLNIKAVISLLYFLISPRSLQSLAKKRIAYNFGL